MVFGTFGSNKDGPGYQGIKKVEDITTIVAVTAQHREMLDQMLKLFDIVRIMI